MSKRKKRDKYTSKGKVGTNKSVTKAIRREYMQNHLERAINQLSKFKRGKNVMLTIPNPNTSETNKRFIRVSARDVWNFNKPHVMEQNTSGSV